MLELLLKRGFAIGSSALAYAAKNQNADMMKVRCSLGDSCWLWLAGLCRQAAPVGSNRSSADEKN
jgi:hypothetical protein